VKRLRVEGPHNGANTLFTYEVLSSGEGLIWKPFCSHRLL
jgi:hypothetical protein